MQHNLWLAINLVKGVNKTKFSEMNESNSEWPRITGDKASDINKVNKFEIETKAMRACYIYNEGID